VAAPGTTTRTTYGAPIATGTIPRIGTTTMGFVVFSTPKIGCLSSTVYRQLKRAYRRPESVPVSSSRDEYEKRFGAAGSFSKAAPTIFPFFKRLLLRKFPSILEKSRLATKK